MNNTVSLDALISSDKVFKKFTWSLLYYLILKLISRLYILHNNTLACLSIKKHSRIYSQTRIYSTSRDIWGNHKYLKDKNLDIFLKKKSTLFLDADDGLTLLVLTVHPEHMGDTGETDSAFSDNTSLPSSESFTSMATVSSSAETTSSSSGETCSMNSAVSTLTMHGEVSRGGVDDRAHLQLKREESRKLSLRMQG